MRQLMEQKKSSDQAPGVAGGGVVVGGFVGIGGDLGNTGNSGAGDDNIIRRNNRGCKSRDFYNWPEQPFEEMDSPLAVQQYIQQLINRNPADIDEILRLPDGQELGAWKIEHLRLFCMQLNKLAAKLQDCCHPETCNQMTATEQWIFLCAAHKQPNECPAIDYTRHTLDGAASLLNSNKYFPSRVTIKESSVAKLGSVCRRVYRIFSHAYYHHFQIFDEFERETHLCKRFSKFVTMYELMPKESLIVPADGSKPEIEVEKSESTDTTAFEASSTDNNSTAENDTNIDTPNNEATAAATTEKQATTDIQNQEPEPKIKLEPQTAPATTTSTPSAAPQAASTPPKTDIKLQKVEILPINVPAKPNPAPVTANPSPPKSTMWTPSPIATNTMVKSSPNARSPASSTGSPAKKQESETKAVKSTTITNPSTEKSSV